MCYEMLILRMITLKLKLKTRKKVFSYLKTKENKIFLFISQMMEAIRK